MTSANLQKSYNYLRFIIDTNIGIRDGKKDSTNWFGPFKPLNEAGWVE